MKEKRKKATNYHYLYLHNCFTTERCITLWAVKHFLWIVVQFHQLSNKESQSGKGVNLDVHNAISPHDTSSVRQ